MAEMKERDQKVLEMLQRLNLMEHEEVFKEQDLSLSDIAELDQEALKSLGIRLVKHRTAIIKYTSDIGSRTPSAPAYHLGEEHGVDPPAYSSLFPGTSQPETGAEARPGEGSSQSSTDSVILTSTGTSAEYQGDRLGVFDYLQQYNECPAYRQRHSVANTQPQYLYRNDYGYWCVSDKLGDSSCGLLNRTSDTVPSINWLYWNSKEGWSSDPELTVSTSLPSVCPVIKISLSGAAARAEPRAGGEYRPTGEWSAGHPVFFNGHRYLCVMPGRTVWSVGTSPHSTVSKLQSGSVTWCPTSPRAALNQRVNMSSWQYSDSGDWQDGENGALILLT